MAYLKHGLHKHPLYAVWADMKSRCNCKTHAQYRLYGGRGISVCAEWFEFEPFYQWALAYGWKRGLYIDRKQVNEGYSPENCLKLAHDEALTFLRQ